MTSDLGRLHVHLHELKDQFVEVCVDNKGDISSVVRDLIKSYVEERIMTIDPKVLALMEEGKEEEAKEKLYQDLIALRAQRAKATATAAKTRQQSKSKQALDKAGVGSPKHEAALKKVAMMEQLLEKEGSGVHVPPAPEEQPVKRPTGVATKVA